MPTTPVTTRSANPRDAARIVEIIDECAAQGHVLPRDVENITLWIESFVVAEARGRVLGAAALAACGPNLAEIRSVAVSDEARGLGVGRSLLTYLIREARALDLDRLFLLTRIPDFFGRLGFVVVDPERLPDPFIADVVHAQNRSFFNKHVMILDMRSPVYSERLAHLGETGEVTKPVRDAIDAADTPARVPTVVATSPKSARAAR
jgi:N-acetylglutamate synthase-like GNAT family acetyltransferase